MDMTLQSIIGADETTHRIDNLPRLISLAQGRFQPLLQFGVLAFQNVSRGSGSVGRDVRSGLLLGPRGLREDSGETRFGARNFQGLCVVGATGERLSQKAVRVDVRVI